MYFQKLFTELKNLAPLLRYDPSKLALTRSFSRERQEISAKNQGFQVMKSSYFGA